MTETIIDSDPGPVSPNAKRMRIEEKPVADLPKTPQLSKEEIREARLKRFGF